MAGDIGNPDPHRKLDDEQLKEAMFYRLEGLGNRVGMGVTEKYASQSHGDALAPSDAES